MLQGNIRKWVSIGFIILSLVLSVYPLSAYEKNDVGCLPIIPEELLDQHQENESYDQNIHRNVMLAQSFIPSLSPLTKVEIKINKPRITQQSLFISIRKSINGSDLTSNTINGNDIPFFIYWIECDFTDIEVTPGETYYIIVSSNTPSEAPYRWRFDNNDDTDPYVSGKFYKSFDKGKTWGSIETQYDYADAAFCTYSYISKTDLVCEGYFNWTEVKPGQDNLTGYFTVRNEGTPFSELNWEIQNWPHWGTWQFSKKNGTSLKPEDGITTVEILVEAPHSNVPDEYLGKITIVNKEDENDTAEIHARLVTPKSKNDKKTFLTKFEGLRQYYITLQQNRFSYNHQIPNQRKSTMLFIHKNLNFLPFRTIY